MTSRAIEHLRCIECGGPTEDIAAAGRYCASCDRVQRNGQRLAPKTLNGRVLLGVGIAGEMEPPDELEPGVLIRGAVHSIYAGPGIGKTWLMLWIVARCVERGQPVAIFDKENGPRILSERLRALGVDPDQADNLIHYYASPIFPMTREERADYVVLLDSVGFALVCFDSWLGFLVSAGLSENENTDVAAWSEAYLRPARDRGITVVILDHVPHDGAHARGATRKKDEVDVQWRLSNTRPFDRDSVGEIVLQREKDREAWLPPSVRFIVGGGSEEFVFRRNADTTEEAADGLMTDRQKRALAALETFAGRGARYVEWRQASGLKGTTFDRAISTLTVRGLVQKRENHYFTRARKEPSREDAADGRDGGAATASTPDASPTAVESENRVLTSDKARPQEPPRTRRRQWRPQPSPPPHP